MLWVNPTCHSLNDDPWCIYEPSARYIDLRKNPNVDLRPWLLHTEMTHAIYFFLIESQNPSILNNSLRSSDAYMRHKTKPPLVHIMACSHYLNRWWNIVNWTLKNKFQWYFHPNTAIFIQENAFENVVWKMTVICHDMLSSNVWQGIWQSVAMVLI